METELPYLKKDNQYFPIIEVMLKGPTTTLKANALIDSGATFSVFRKDIADYLGIQIIKGKQIYLTGIGGRILGYLHRVKVSIDEENFFECKVVFSEEFTVSFNILGRDSFFSRFLITFNEKERKVILKER